MHSKKLVSYTLVTSTANRLFLLEVLFDEREAFVNDPTKIFDPPTTTLRVDFSQLDTRTSYSSAVVTYATLSDLCAYRWTPRFLVSSRVNIDCRW